MPRKILLVLFAAIYTSVFATPKTITTFLPNQFTAIWNTNNISTGSSTINEITIPTNPAYANYNYNVDWGDGNTDTGITGNITHTYAAPGTYTVSISGTFPAIYFNNTGDKEKIIEILEWGNIQWQTMENAFYGCNNLNFDAIDAPDLSQVTSLKSMFRGCSIFNGIVNNWDVSTITDMSGLFATCGTFNRPLDLWNVISVTNMEETFMSASSFNEPLDNWNTASVTTMKSMFSSANRFNQNINNWDVSNVTNMDGTFRYTGSFNQPLNNWNVSNVTDMSSMFQGSGFNYPIGNWIVDNVTNMSAMFRESVFNHPISSWNVSLVTDMSMMFQRHRTFNHPLNSWDVSNVTNMSSMFDGWYWDNIYNQPLNNWDVSNVTDMSFMFRDNSGFNQDISMWNVGNVTDMEGMFSETIVFNQDISGWDVSNVTNMSKMFQIAQVFNQPLNNWNMDNVTDVSFMFFRTPLFDQSLDNWNLSMVTNFQNMFNQATSFDQDISGWNTASATNMTSMFNQATSFNQNLGSWNISGVTNMSSMLSNSGISQENYDNILIGWEAQTVSNNVNLGAISLNYCDGLAARQSLIDNSGWNITGDIVNCSFVLCTNLTSPVNGDTNVPASANLTWAETPNATGYYVTVRIIRGGIESIPFNDHQIVGGNITGLNLETPGGDDLLESGDEVFVTIVPYNDTDGPATGCTEESFTVVPSWVNSPDAFKLTYDTRLLESGSTAANQLKIETNTGYPDYLDYDFSIDWGDDQFNNNVTGDITHTYNTPGIYTISIIGSFPAPLHDYSNTDAIKLLSIDQWGTQDWQSMERAFYYCENMEYNATDIPNLTNVSNMASMFSGCYLFNGEINSWNVSNVTNMSYMLIAARIFNQPLDQWDVSNVENMSGMFFACEEFNQPIGNWTTANVTNTSRMFNGAKVFNEPINNWDVSNVTNMYQMFANTDDFNQSLDNWDVSNVTDMHEMFYSAEAFNQNIDSWNVANVTTMEQMFRYAILFNQPLNSWTVNSVNNMVAMFGNATAFDQPLNNWNVANVTNMRSMFSNASVFDQNIDSWNVTKVTDMSSMFNYATAFDQPLNNWDVNSVVNMSSMFRGAAVFNQPLNNWNVSAVANMTSMFEDAVIYNQPMNSWNVSSVTLMESMFEDATAYDQPMNNWDVAVVTNFEAMFKNASAFNQALNSWNTGEALHMAEMFFGASTFDQDLGSWNTTFVSSMQDMFNSASSFNQSLDSWNVASVATMEGMFENALAFNGNIGSWNVRGVNTMENMFKNATTFNQSLNNWRINGVENMEGMFQGASALNQAFDLWNPGNVTMRNMFHDAISFDQNLGDWNISGVTNMQNMLDDTALIRQNYDNTLIAWSEQTLISGLTLGAANLLYCDAVEERQSIIDTYGWNITGDLLDCPIPECTQLTSPLNGDTDVPVNTNLTWEPVLFAKGYRVTVGTSTGGNDIVNNATVNNETFYEFATDFNTGDDVYVTITPFNDTGDAVGPCSEENFTISSDPATIPECTMLVEPTNGQNDVLVTSDLSWTPISNADGYKITVGTASGASDILNNIDVGNVTTYDLATDLPEDSDIYITIIPYNDEGDATSCSEASFTTELIPVTPECTNLTSPLNATTNVPIDTDISWSPVNGATGYLVSVGVTQDGIEVANSIDVGNNTSYSFTGDLQENRTHYVRIIPYNAVGDATGCTEENFRTGNSTLNDPPACTSLISPLHNATNISITTDFTWSTAANADGYYLTVGTTTGGNDILNAFDVVGTNTYDLPTDLPEATQIYTTIVPYNSFGTASGCAEEFFTTETLLTAPTCTSLSSPANAATDISISTNLTWNAIANADGYYLTVGTASSGNDILDAFDVIGTNTYDLPSNLPEATQIFVTIVPYNSVGSATSCTEESFTTETMATAPTCTSLSSPVNAATDISISTNLTWNAIANADGYYLTVGTASSGNDILNAFDVVGTNTYDLPSNLPEATQIFVTIVPYNSVGSATGCTEESFTTETMATAPTCTSLSSPANAATDISISTNLTWNAIANADGYYLTFGTTTGGNDILNAFDVVGTNTYDLPANLPEATQIFVTIVPYNSVGSAIGCVEESFTTETMATAPTCTSLSSPANAATDISISTNLTWNAIANADGYYLTFGTTTGGNDILNAFDVVGTNTYDLPANLPEATQIFVTIVPYNSVGSAIGCVEESFTTETMATAPTCTSLSSPANAAMDISISTSLTWNAIANADGYYLTVGTASGGNDILNAFDVVGTNTYDLPTNLPGATQIFVTIFPYNSVGSAIGCVEESFNTETMPTIPDCISVISPSNGETDVSLTTTISWEESSNANGYHLTVGTSSGNNDVIDHEDVSILTTYSFNRELEEATTYYVTVIPYNELGEAMNCEEFVFSTITQDDTLYGFSPNGDGINDFWVIDGIESVPENTVFIYNRWGDMVFQIQGYDNQSNVFNGTANKKTQLGASELPSGTYFFNIQVPGEHNLKKLQGFVVLKR